MNSSCCRQALSTPLLVLIVTLALAGPAQAGRFMTVVESETFDPGTGEVLQAGSWDRLESRSGTMDAGSWQLGCEFGLAPRLQVGLALPAYNVSRAGGRTETTFDGTAMWGVWNLAAPDAARIGMSLVMAVSQDSEAVGGEWGVVLERSRGPLAVVANISLLRTVPHDPSTESGSHLVGRLGASRDLGRGFAVALETEWLLDHFGTLGYRPAALQWGPALLYETPRIWVLAGMMWDPDPATVQRGAALRLQAGLPF